MRHWLAKELPVFVPIMLNKNKKGINFIATDVNNADQDWR